jgi:hypothetical protein
MPCWRKGARRRTRRPMARIVAARDIALGAAASASSPCARDRAPPSGKAGTGQQAPLRLRRSPLRVDCPAMLGLAACRITRSVRCALCAQTDAASQRWKRAARAAASPALLGAAKSLRPLPDPDFAETPRFALREPWCCCEAGGGWPVVRLCGAEERRARGQRAQRASTSNLRHLSERSERSERSELCRRPRDRAPEGSRPQADRRSRSATGHPPAASLAPNLARLCRGVMCGFAAPRKAVFRLPFPALARAIEQRR